MEIRFTDRELDVMGVLWDRGPSTVAEVREALRAGLAYTTVLTMLRTLEEKGYIGHVQKGKAYRYHPLVDRVAAGRGAIGRLIRKVFQGSPELLLTQLVSEHDLSEDELRRLSTLLEERLALGGEGRSAGPDREYAEPEQGGAP